ncbi:2-hydroxyacid dehydrogenase [Cecembia calidifontis]|jgi:glyoxylate/hydroxypyruvate reductase A|uniref:Glyoxylate/hydroxypyruvate reductase A n=1 Tax=Cecembia calidifontis TaxID=1187080 RepID=A0A4Q7PBD5_9BACT|nr:glyoxylate/hydroxypyruvate reductase A [Cecembia calidifontis]RZS97616.1 glyoxylate/hydroxypyruvate reductase A [Cecembia calidifontis]
MGIAIISPGRDVTVWVENIKKLDQKISIQVYPDISDEKEVQAVILWQHPKGILSKFPNLKLICSMGAGVDHILSDESIPQYLPITRIVDGKLTFSMTNYVIMGVLNFHRQIDRYQKDKKRKVWDMSNPEIPITVGIMGVGELGGDVIEKLQFMNIPVAGFGNSPKENLEYPYFDKTKIDEFLASVNVLVCMLPLTAETEGILNIELFRRCNKGTYLINVARGRHLVEEDLLTALDEGFLSGALLDVFHQEPLPPSHPFWDREEITITPHIASVTNPEAASPQIVENYHRMLKHEPLINQIDRIKGY